MDHVYLDSGPVTDLAYDQRAKPIERAIQARIALVIPDVVRYETRRNLLWLQQNRQPVKAPRALARLDDLCADVFISHTTPVILERAAEMWASLKAGGFKTAGDSDIDFDTIIAAHMRTRHSARRNPVVLTDNARHFQYLDVEAMNWDDFEAYLQASGF